MKGHSDWACTVCHGGLKSGDAIDGLVYVSIYRVYRGADADDDRCQVETSASPEFQLSPNKQLLSIAVSLNPLFRITMVICSYQAFVGNVFSEADPIADGRVRGAVR
jgi:hypothetical protein